MYDLKKRLEAITRFLPEFEDPEFEFGRWEEPEDATPGVITLDYFLISRTGQEFIRACYDHGWVINFDWPEWKGTEEAKSLRDEEEVLNQADPEQLAKLLTVLIRQERFVDGALNSAYESGLLVGILIRAKEISKSL
jgi:hypothetical protein